MRHYTRKADRIDKERGDVLQLHREDMEPLFADGFPPEARHTILDALFGWFVGGEEPTLDEPLANAYLQAFINRQKSEVLRYLDFCRVRVENRAAAGKNAGRQVTTLAGNSKETVKVTVKGKQSEPFTVTGDGSRVNADATLDPSLTATVPTEADARKTIASFAPPATEENYGKEFAEAESRSHVGEKFAKSEQYACDFMLKMLDEKENEQTRNALTKFRREIGADMMWRTVVRFYNDKTSAKKRGEPFNNPGALFMSRLKAVREAMATVGPSE